MPQVWPQKDRGWGERNKCEDLFGFLFSLLFFFFLKFFNDFFLSVINGAGAQQCVNLGNFKN